VNYSRLIPAIALTLPLVLFTWPGYSQVQDTEPPEHQTPVQLQEVVIEELPQRLPASAVERIQAARQQLQQIQQSLLEKRNQIAQLRIQLEAETDNTERDELQIQIDREETDLNNLRRSFENIALGGVDLSVFNPEEQSEQVNWQQELQLILRPLFQKLTDLTEKPRQIERLENHLSLLENQRRIAQRALDNVVLILDDSLDENTRQRMTGIQQAWVRQLTDIERERGISQLQLKVLQDDGDTILQQIRQSIRDFLTGSGFNLALAIAAFFLTLFMMKGLYLLYSQLHRQNGIPTTTGRRMFAYGYQALTIFISVLIALLALYLVGDMMLMVLSLILLAIFFLGLRNYLPQFINETRLLLDVGAVRERERVHYRGLPWMVRSLGVYSHLNNPALDGELRLPLTEMLGLVSRPFSEDESWFPTNKGDWVLMEDGTIGQILSQTPETVQVRSRGSISTYSTPDFMTNDFRNLTEGFGIAITFGIDYQHQPLSTTEIPKILRHSVEQGIKETELGKHVDNILVEFKEAATSSLNYLIYVSMKGAAADSYFAISRLLQRICVDACNEHGWVIPFDQLTVHAGTGFAPNTRPGTAETNQGERPI